MTGANNGPVRRLPLRPHREFVAQHIQALTGDPNASVCIRVLGDNEPANVEGTLEELWPQIERRNLAGGQVYIVVNGGGHSTSEITRVRALFFDGDDMPTPERWHVPPDFIVRRDASHFHPYWLVRDMPCADFHDAQERIRAYYGAKDPMHDLPRILRLAGTLHTKLPPKGDGISRLVTIEVSDEARDASFDARTPAELLAGLPEVVPPAKAVSEPVDFEWDTEIDLLRARQWVSNEIAKGRVPIEGNRDNTCYTAVGFMRDFGLSSDAAFDEVSRLCDAGDYPGEDHSLKDIVASVYDSENVQNAAGVKSFGVLFPEAAAALDADQITLDQALIYETLVRAAERELGLPTNEAMKLALAKLIGDGAREQPQTDNEKAGKESHCAPLDGDEITEPYSHDALALMFRDAYGVVVRYVDAWGKWMAFDRHRWAEMPVPEVWNRMLPIARGLLPGVETANQRRALVSRPTISGASDLARVHLLEEHDAWDADPWILNTPGGVVDLRTGDLHPASPEMLCRKMTAVAPGGECPRWLQFLTEITQGDIELQGYLQRLAGYALVGETGEQMLAFLYGTGGNGKGVFLNTLGAIMGDYAQTAPTAMFTETHGERHPTELAMLQGARLVVAQEVNEGQAWNEQRIKELTGGDPIAARFMRQDFFKFDPQHTLVIAGNHKPRLRNVDEAMRRRFHMVPFTAKISPRDTHLAKKLKAEWPGILQWAINGCLEWQIFGLAPPTAVLYMTAEYFESQDNGPEWLRERCVVAPEEKASFADLLDDYRVYMSENREEPKGSKQFAQWLGDQGFHRYKGNTMRGFKGLSLRPRETPAEHAF